VLKIGDFSQLGRVSVRMLRHYDSLGLLKPAHVDYLSGYRFYSVEQLPRLNRILALKDLGLSLEQISTLLKREELPASELRGMLALRQSELERELRDGRERLGRIEARLRQIEREGEPSPYEVVLKETAARTLVSARAVVPALPDMPRYRCSLYEGLYGWLAARGAGEPGPELAIYHVAEFRETEIDTEVAVTVEPGSQGGAEPPKLPGARTAVRELPAAKEVASVVHHGSLWGVPDAIGALFAWIGENGYSPAGPYREIHVFWRENDLAVTPGGLDSIVTELQLPVEKTAFAGG
jgi:DNA-binding transcriptional MerR regulator/effector-binding domain-containing protein